MSAKRDFKYFTSQNEEEIFLGGNIRINLLKSDFGLSKADSDMYSPINPLKIEDAGIQIHYLGYYLKWHPQEAYYYANKHGGFEASPEREQQVHTANTILLMIKLMIFIISQLT